MILGNKYLEIYKEIRNEVLQDNALTREDISYFQKRLTLLDNDSSRYPIGLIASYWSTLVIRKEMNLDWLQYEKR